MKYLKIVIYYLLALSLSPASMAQEGEDLVQPYYISPRTGDQHIDLNGQWDLGYKGEKIGHINELSGVSNWIQTEIPAGAVHWSLYRAGKFPNMYEHLNSKLYEWVEDSVWYYKRTFDYDQTKSGNYAMLVFDGIDYFSRIWLNGELLGSHAGMYGGPATEVSKLLKAVNNELVVEVRSGKEMREKGAAGRRNPGNVIKGWEFTGGVGAEPFFTVGMWQGVRLETIPAIHMERPFLITKSIEAGKANLEIRLEVFAENHSLNYELHPWSQQTLHKKPFYGESLYKEFTTRNNEKEAVVSIELTDAAGRKTRKEWPVDLFDKRNWIQKEFEIKDPRLWWPNGMGDPDLYKVSLTLKVENRLVDQIDFEYGIRTIETVRSAGPQVGDFWDNWQFVVNGKPFFVKGVNWMPADVLLDLPYEKYDWLTQTAQNAGVQMFRIWGAGLIETEDFYKACNRAGIMVWGEYSMANWDAPEFPKDVFEAQVIWNIYRLRNHPSLAVHCGGNEYNPYSESNAALTGILERSVEMFDGTRPFRRASPDEGSIHTYPDMDPTWYLRNYRYVPYIAESGMHSITEAKSLYEIIDPQEFKDLGEMYSDSFKDNHPEFLHHFVEFQADRIPRMLSRASHIANMHNPTLEEIAEASQTGAGEFYQVMSDLMQSNYPVTTGLMPWVFKRPWPVVSGIHLVDGFGQPSAPYYFLKRTYEDTHVVIRLENLLLAPGERIPLEAAIIHAGNDENVLYTLDLKILDDAFQIVSAKSFKVEGLSAVTEVGKHEFLIPSDWDDRYFFVLAELKNTDGRLVSRSVYWPRALAMMKDEFTQKKYRESPQPWPIFEKGPWLKEVVSQEKTQLETRILYGKTLENGNTSVRVRITNKGDKPAFGTSLDILGRKRIFYADDNFFWLGAGESREIEIKIKWREESARGSTQLVVKAWNAGEQVLKF